MLVIVMRCEHFFISSFDKQLKATMMCDSLCNAAAQSDDAFHGQSFSPLHSFQASDLSKPIDKKLYKGTSPSCHNFNQTASTSEGAPLLVGFTTGQIQLVYPGRRETGKLYNEEVSPSIRLLLVSTNF